MSPETTSWYSGGAAITRDIASDVRRHDPPSPRLQGDSCGADTISGALHNTTATRRHDGTTEMDAYEEAVLFTLAALESRLDRLEYCVSGLKEDENENGDKPKTLQERVQRLERILQELSARTSLVRDVEELSMWHCHVTVALGAVLRNSKHRSTPTCLSNSPRSPP